MRLVKVAEGKITEKRLEAFNHFCLSSQQKYLVIHSQNYKENFALELVYEPKKHYDFPFHIYRVPIPDDKPLTAVIHDIPLDIIYSNSEDPLESQQLSMEPIYVAECTSERLVSTTSQTGIAPNPLKDGTILLASLNSFGSMILYKFYPLYPDEFTPVCSITEFLLTKVFTDTQTNINDFDNFQMYIGKRWILSFTWEKVEDKHILYLGTAYNYLIVLEWDEKNEELKEFYRMETKLDRLNYLKIVDNFLLVCDSWGVIQLFTNHRKENENFSIEEAATLWPKKDHLGCRHAEILYSKDFDCYMILTSKGSHLLLFRVAKNGTLIERKNINTHSVKITGIVALNSTDYLISTLIGKVLFIKMNILSQNDYSLDIADVPMNFIGKHFQIISFSPTLNMAMFAMVQYRNKEYVMLSKRRLRSASIKMFTLSTIDYLKEIISIKAPSFDSYIDYICAFEANLTKHYTTNYEKLDDIIKIVSDLDNLSADEKNLQIIQTKYNIFQMLYSYERLNFHGPKKRTELEASFLKIRLKMVQIYCRLEYLSSLPVLTDFQNTASRSMVRMFKYYSKILQEACDSKDEEEEDFLCRTNVSNEPDDYKEKSKSFSTKIDYDENDSYDDYFDSMDVDENEDTGNDKNEKNDAKDNENDNANDNAIDKQEIDTTKKDDSKVAVVRKPLIIFDKLQFFEKVENFLSIITEQYEKLNFKPNSANDIFVCPFCDQVIDDNLIKCSQKHPTSICPLSSIIISSFSKVFCKHCKAVFYEDEERLKELYKDKVKLTCLFCNFYLVKQFDMDIFET